MARVTAWPGLDISAMPWAPCSARPYSFRGSLESQRHHLLLCTGIVTLVLQLKPSSVA